MMGSSDCNNATFWDQWSQVSTIDLNTDLIYKWIAHPAHDPATNWEYQAKMDATVVANCQTDMTLFILMLNLLLSNPKTNLKN